MKTFITIFLTSAAWSLGIALWLHDGLIAFLTIGLTIVIFGFLSQVTVTEE